MTISETTVANTRRRKLHFARETVVVWGFCEVFDLACGVSGFAHCALLRFVLTT